MPHSSLRGPSVNTMLSRRLWKLSDPSYLLFLSHFRNPLLNYVFVDRSLYVVYSVYIYLTYKALLIWSIGVVLCLRKPLMCVKSVLNVSRPIHNPKIRSAIVESVMIDVIYFKTRRSIHN